MFGYVLDEDSLWLNRIIAVLAVECRLIQVCKNSFISFVFLSSPSFAVVYSQVIHVVLVFDFLKCMDYFNIKPLL